MAELDATEFVEVVVVDRNDRLLELCIITTKIINSYKQ